MLVKYKDKTTNEPSKPIHMAISFFIGIIKTNASLLKKEVEVILLTGEEWTKLMREVKFSRNNVKKDENGYSASFAGLRVEWNFIFKNCIGEN